MEGKEVCGCICVCVVIPVVGKLRAKLLCLSQYSLGPVKKAA